jgi:predicted outer membrane repeat protein
MAEISFADGNINSGSIADNKAIHGSGGGIYNWGGTVTMNSGGFITGNTATYDGGGIYSDNSGTVDMYVGSTITGNTIIYGSGGGIYNIHDAKVIFKDSLGNPVAYWPGYDTANDPYGFFTPHNIRYDGTIDDITDA